MLTILGFITTDKSTQDSSEESLPHIFLEKTNIFF